MFGSSRERFALPAEIGAFFFNLEKKRLTLLPVVFKIDLLFTFIWTTVNQTAVRIICVETEWGFSEPHISKVRKKIG